MWMRKLLSDLCWELHMLSPAQPADQVQTEAPNSGYLFNIFTSVSLETQHWLYNVWATG